MAQHRSLMMIGRLSERSGLPVSTIKYYLREKLLPGGIKTSRTTVYYGPEHVTRLRTIRHLQARGLSLGRIRTILMHRGEANGAERRPPSDRREAIIDSAFSLFMKNGLEMTSITDIVKSARISRNTFYREFKSKREAFVACLDKIFKDMIDAFNNDIRTNMALPEGRPDDAWHFLGMQSSWTEFMNLLGATIVNDPPLLNKMLDDFIELRARQISEGFDRYVQRGIIRPVDTRLLGLIVLGIIDYCSRHIRSEKSTDTKKIYDTAIDILMNGIGATAGRVS